MISAKLLPDPEEAETDKYQAWNFGVHHSGGGESHSRSYTQCPIFLLMKRCFANIACCELLLHAMQVLGSTGLLGLSLVFLAGNQPGLLLCILDSVSGVSLIRRYLWSAHSGE
jgi:hypothetical protein